MASDPSSFSPIGVEAMALSGGGYFMAGGSSSTGNYGVGGGGIMSAAEVPHFHPGMLLDHGGGGGFGFGFGLGDAAFAGGGATAATAADLGAHYAASNIVLASFASQLFPPPPQDDDRTAGGRTTPPPPPEEEEMDDDEVYGVPASLRCPSRSGTMAAAVWPSNKKPSYGIWTTSTAAAGGPAAVSAGHHDDPYHHHLAGAGLSDDYAAGGFHYHHHLAAAANASPASELSLTLCSNNSISSSDNSALTEQPPPPPRSSRSRMAPPPPPHFAVVVARSRYAGVVQGLLNDVVGHMLHGVADVAAGDGDDGSCSGVDGAPSSAVSSNRFMASDDVGGARWGQAQRLRTNLLKTLQLMDEKYNQCLDEIQSTTAKFNTLMHSSPSPIIAGGVSSNSNSSICAPFAHRAVSAMYRGLRRRLAGEIMAAASCWGESSSSAVTVAGGGGDVEMQERRSWESAFIQKHWSTAQQLRRAEKQQCWRPQRGLPEKSVAVLKAWMFENFLHPYPKDHEKDVLAVRSGLTRSQVSNWFINARVRLWKPMIEEMYQESSGAERLALMEQQQQHHMHMNKRRICELEDGGGGN